MNRFVPVIFSFIIDASDYLGAVDWTLRIRRAKGDLTYKKCPAKKTYQLIPPTISIFHGDT